MSLLMGKRSSKGNYGSKFFPGMSDLILSDVQFEDNMVDNPKQGADPHGVK